MSASIKVDTEPHSTHPAENGKPANNGRLAEKGPLSESAMSDEMQPDACLELPPYFARKALATRVLGALLLIPASPLIVLLVVLTRCTSSGPGLFRQTRVGKGGREYTMYKIRTMHQDAEEATGPTWCQPSDSRITCFGLVLRFLHLDELPQLINIVRGEMDLIGPRPERPEIITRLVDEVPRYAERFAVLPGVTGLAQINLPPDVNFNCVRRKLVLDLEYMNVASWGMDLRILLCTMMRMMGVRHGRAVRVLRLDYLRNDDLFDGGCQLQSDIARQVLQTYLYYREQLGDDSFVVAGRADVADETLAHAKCLRFRSDSLAEGDQLEIPGSASLSEVARAHPR